MKTLRICRGHLLVTTTKRQKGFTLIETLAALFLAGIIFCGLASAVCQAVSIERLVAIKCHERNIAEVQMIHVLRAPYSETYEPVPIVDEGYNISIMAELDGGVQRIDVTVSHSGISSFTCTDYKRVD